MSGSPRPVQRRRKRDSTTQALDHLNGLMNTHKRPAPVDRPHASTPHPSRRFTYSGRRDSPDDASQLSSPKTLPSKPRRVPPTELLTPRRSLRFLEPLPDESTSGGSTRKSRHHETPELRHGTSEQLEEPSEEEVPEETETSAGDAAHMGGRQMGSGNQPDSYEPSDNERGSEDEGPLPGNDEMLDGEGLRSDVELFSDDDNQPTFIQSRPPSSGHETPTRLQSGRPQDAKKGINSESTQPDGNISSKNGKGTPEQPTDRQHSHPSGSSPTNRRPIIAVEITRTEEYSSSISVTTEGHHSGDISVANNARISDQGANIEDTTLDEDSTFQPPEESSSSVPSPDPTSSESDSQLHSVKTTPEASSPPRHSNKRKRATTDYRDATSQVNMGPGRESSRAPREASPPVSHNNRVRGYQHSHSQEEPESHHATQSAQEEPVTQEPINREEPAPEEPTVQEQDRKPERLEERSWFKEASKLDNQVLNWKRLTQTARALESRARPGQAADFAGIRHEISCLIQVYTDIIDNLRDGTGPSNHDVPACAVSLKKITMQGRGHLEDVYNLSTEGNQDRGRDLVEGFEGHVVPLLVQLILVCFQAYHARSRLFPEAYDHLHRALEVLLGRCDQIHGLIKGGYVHCCAVSLGARLPLKHLVKSLEGQRLKIAESNRRERTERPMIREGRREWTDEEGHALVEGLQRFQGPNRYYQICSFYPEGIGKRGMREVRRESERLYSRISPQIRESVRTDQGRQEWGWLLKVRE
ncbi:hypothetical protein BO78DRAFT_430566 [Aspergillus sclerotiicarbonarius CBS 121057]|uniref:Uncharacterized protein n=1 Tax=Aspergillus sclerotiicarbonarius (strain CBS 121057 / IBT 28362) TaxID=1448318 RepID=A0A319E7N5_ASPSB|nr:hypothetical protein BO78DRAFT_430566 [Aspergillus sclerotiicarbonarius CBS 121057]